jgi:hypothetical protein
MAKPKGSRSARRAANGRKPPKRLTRRTARRSDFAGKDRDEAALATIKEAAERVGRNTGDISDETASRHIRLIKAKLVEVEQAKTKVRQRNGELRTLRKTATDDGLDTDALKRALVVEETPVGEVIQTERNVGRYLCLMGVPVGHQWSMFDDPDQPPLDPFAMGEQAGREGAPMAPPFDPGTPAFVQYEDGWRAGQKTITDTMGPPASEPAAPPE